MGRPFAKASFPLTGFVLGSLSKFTLTRAEYQHELAVLRVNSDVHAIPEYLTGQPVVVEYGVPDMAEVFVGYVALARPKVSPRQTAPGKMPPGRVVDVYCLGATFPMKEQRQRVFSSMSADAVVKKIAAEYQLDAIVESHSRVWPALTQAGRSDWQFLCQVARDVGYVLYAHNTQVRMHNPTSELRRNARSALTYDFNAASTVSNLPGGRSINSFSPMISELLPDADGSMRARRVLYDIDRRTKQVIAVEDRIGPAPLLGSLGMDPLFTQFVSGRSLDSIDDGVSWLSDMREGKRWHITAKASVQGDVRIAPAQPLYFRNLPPDYAGYWSVRSATHVIDLYPGQAGRDALAARYTCELELGRDGLGESVGQPDDLPQRTYAQQDFLGVPNDVRSTAQMTKDGYWRASFVTTAVPVA